MVEFPQSVSNLTDIGQAIYDAVKHKSLKLYADSELRREAAFSVAKESARGIQIVKLKRGHQIDAIVALATAVCAASSQGEPVMPGLFVAGPGQAQRAREELTPEQKDQRVERLRAEKQRRMDKWLQGD